MKNQKIDTKQLTALALLIAMQIVLERLFSIRTPIVTIGFSFIPIVVAAMIYGPVQGGIVAAAGDWLGAVLFPIGAPFLGFTLTAFFRGAIYGIGLHGKERSMTRVIMVCFVVNAVDLLLNTYWLSEFFIKDSGYLALLATRLVKPAVMFAVQVFVIKVLDKQLISRFVGRFAV